MFNKTMFMLCFLSGLMDFTKHFGASFTCLSTFQPVSSHVDLLLQEFIALDFQKKWDGGFLKISLFSFHRL